jgi:serine palmitoyltransferase
MTDLEEKIKFNIIAGQPKTGRPWRKIIIMVEGIYSMEGTIVNLPEVIRLKRKYKCYVYVDEAHSIGAIGHRGRGVCDYYGCDPTDVDVLMGTFTKSFGAAGGYIAGRKTIIHHIVTKSHSHIYCTAMANCIALQIICAINVIMGLHATPNGKFSYNLVN